MSPTELDAQSVIRLSALSSAMRTSGLCVLHQNSEHRFDLSENVPIDWPVTELVGLCEAEIFPEPVAKAYSAAVDRTLSGGQLETITLELGDGLRQRTFQARLQRDEHGVVSTITDITNSRASEAAVTSLLREVSHRSKNLLAIVQSVAMQTAHHSGDIQDFLDKFRGRLHALSSTQDLVTESDWRGSYLHTLVLAQLNRVGSSRLAHLHITGANPLLGPNASLHIGLAIHELGINATRFGALSDDKPGHVWVDAHLVDQPGTPTDLIIEWQEVGIEQADMARPPRFGTLVLERIVPLSVGGTAEFSVQPDSVRYRLVVPADQFEV